MLVEGKGHVAPASRRIALTRAEVIVLFEEAKRRDAHRNYSGRRDSWGRGIRQGQMIGGIGEVSQSVLPILVGLVGEYGVQRFLENLRPEWRVAIDTTLLQSDDRGVDLVAYGLKVQVKTKQKRGNANLVRVGQQYGWHVVLFAHWNMVAIGAQVWTLGWSWKSAVVALPPKESSAGDWMNYEIATTSLEPMSRLVSEIEAWKGAQ